MAVAVATVEVEAEVGGVGGGGSGAPGLKAVTLSTSHTNATVISRPAGMRPSDEVTRLCGGHEAEHKGTLSIVATRRPEPRYL